MLMVFQKEPYLKVCESVIHQYIQDATRLEKFAFNIDPLEAFELSYGIVLDVEISSRMEEDIQLGELRSTKVNSVFKDIEQYERGLQELIEREITNPRNFLLVKDKIEDHSFGTLHNSLDLYRSEDKVSYCYDCAKCSGCGSIECSDCQGSGTCSCNHCQGSGSIRCTQTVETSLGPKTQTVYRHCPLCWGSGKQKCRKCHGSRKITCPDCKGRKFYTKIATIITTAEPHYSLSFFREDTPNYIIEAFHHFQLHTLNNFGNVTKRHIAEINELSLQFVYDAKCPFARFESDIQGQTIFWILLGENPVIFESSNVVEILLIDDLYRLEQKAKIPNIFKPYIALSCRKVVADFTESEVNQDLIAGASDISNLEKNRNHLSRSVSIDYLKITYRSLKSLTNAINFWSYMKWSLLSFIFIYIYIFCFTLLFYSSTDLTLLSQDQSYWLTSFYHHMGKENSIWEFFKVSWKEILFPLLAFSFIPYFCRIIWLRTWLKRKVPFFLKWMKLRNTAPKRCLSLGFLMLLFSIILLVYAKFPIYDGQFLGIIPIDLMMTLSQKIHFLWT